MDKIAKSPIVGMTGVNTGIVSDPVAPFGGVKESGFGQEGGRHRIEEFQISKVGILITKPADVLINRRGQTITLGGWDVPHTPL